MLRDIITINEEKCTGCGLCIPGCPEGAIQMIDGKARLVSDLSCDGLGACLGHCPEGAISIEKREAEPYNENAVMENIVKKGKNTIKAHLKHLRDHGETEYLQEALDYLRVNNIENPLLEEIVNNRGQHSHTEGGCPGSKIMQFVSQASGVGCPGSAALQFKDKNRERKNTPNHSESGEAGLSALSHWPVQLHLLTPRAPFLKNSDLLLSADCVAHAAGDFHRDYLKGKTLAVACPKLDSNIESYIEKLTAMIDQSKINTLTVLMMEVPCCGGLLSIAMKAAEKAERKVPLKKIVVSIRGELISEEWL